ncbi:DUF4142 domain-containing protein [Brevundimonas aurifodinae]|uniref:DUF4142 domain-containing protein n=2 Tax=Brevundimonas TaxID=41275 RepID=A0ABV1NNM1_9CAUL|nr:MAG: hypothetical protein B7Z42_06775 [Brevundimonas sp. 12-68-7]OYX34198.1 MAG: hypothetical protein B7Z01_06465 [Brevundimonas subvibrioides]
MLRTLFVGAACAALLAGCNQAEDQDPVNAVQDAASAPVGQMSAATMGANTVGGYVPNAAMGDMYEIQAAEIAMERTQNAQVRELAQMIMTDHRAASEKMTALAPQAAPNVTLPTELDERRQGLIDNLRTADAAAFDQVYLDQQVAAHQEALTLHRGFADNTDAPQLATHAREVVPKIEMHLERARALQEAM